MTKKETQAAFKKTADEQGVKDYDKKIAAKLIKESAPVILELKKHHNRKRPYELDKDLKAVKKWCQRCISDEERYGRSRRTNCLKIHTNNPGFWDDIQKSVDMYKATGEWEFDQRIIEMQLKIFGSECNLDCHMCIHTNSSIRQRGAEKGVWSKTDRFSSF